MGSQLHHLMSQMRVLKLLSKTAVILFFCFEFSYSQTSGKCNGITQCNSLDSSNLTMRTVGQGWFNGLGWPNDGLGHILVYEYGLLVGAMINGSPHVSDGENFTNFSAGPILASTTQDTGSNPRYRVYKVQKNWQNLAESDIKIALKKDYDEWPADLGAPVDSSGKPLIYGDQMLWMVYNDTKNVSPLVGPPLRAEVHTAAWSYKNDPILRNVVYTKHVVTNKNDTPWVNTYIGTLTDPGLTTGTFGPGVGTFAATDTTIGVAYLYYPSGSSTAYYGLEVPAAGYVHIQGPLVGSPGSSGFQTGKILSGKKNLGMTSAVRFNIGTPHPAPTSARGRYNGLTGLWVDSTYIRDPISGRVLRYTNPGDPVSGTGWTDYSDKTPLNAFYYQYASTGPFDLQPGESQEVVGAYIVAQGRDHLLSINALRYIARYAKSAFPFIVGLTLPKPAVSVSTLLRKVILSWDAAPEIVLPPLCNYRFQGYRVYQGESPSGPWHRIATFDKKDTVSYLQEEDFSPTDRLFTLRTVQVLPNKGLQYYFSAERDSIKGTPLVLGSQYYFGVTAFWYDPGSRPMNKESDIVPISATVQSPIAGSVFQDQMTVMPHDRPGDDAVKIVIVDPTVVTGKKYTLTVAFSPVDSSIRWNVTEDPNIPRLVGLSDTTGLLSNPVVDGFIAVVRKPLVGIRRETQSPKGWEYIPAENRFMTGAGTPYIMDGFFSGIVYPRRVNLEGRGTMVHPDSLKRVEMRFGETQKAYRYVAGVRVFPPDWPRDQAYIPFIKAHGPGYVYQDFVDVPFTVWEIDSLDGDSAPKQLNAAFIENNDSLYSASGKYLGRGNVDGKWAPTTAANGGEERVYIFSSQYSPTVIPFYTTRDPLFKEDSVDVMYILYPKADSTLRKDHQTTWTAGDRFIITPNYNLTNGRTFHFTNAGAIIADASIAKGQGALDRITVFPNPYLGGHSLEFGTTDRFVTFTNLPSQCIIRIFNLSGRLVRTMNHNSLSQSLERWNLRNDEGIAIASGLYVAHIDARDIGSKILKLMILFPDERIRTY